MKRYLIAGLLALSLLTVALPGRALGNGKCSIGASFYFTTSRPQAGPWYLYWPLEAHFAVPAPHGYPYWPSPMSLPGMAPLGGGPPAPPMGPVPPAPPMVPPMNPVPAAQVQPSMYQPVGYSVPAYWYAR